MSEIRTTLHRQFTLLVLLSVFIPVWSNANEEELTLRWLHDAQETESGRLLAQAHLQGLTEMWWRLQAVDHKEALHKHCPHVNTRLVQEILLGLPEDMYSQNLTVLVDTSLAVCINGPTTP